jgi:hypothetical protein
MTHRDELERLQVKERACGCTVTFYRDEAGHLSGVFYLDPEGTSKERAGVLLDPLTFAERARPKLEAWQGRGPKYRRGVASGLVWPVRCYP